MLRRLLATASLGAILACSGLGVCWKQFVPRAHDCCENSSGMAATDACGSAAVPVAVLQATAPVASQVRALLEARDDTLPSAAAFASSFHVKPPPLVLRN